MDMPLPVRPAVLRNLKPIEREFYNRDPRLVARELLGKLLIRKERGEAVVVGRIVETEAYLGTDDAAAHSAAGRTTRNAVLFGSPGLAYVYFIYGMHYCLNVSCLPDGEAGGVLFRALEPVAGIYRMARNRGVGLSKVPRMTELRSLTSGPGRLAEAFGIDRERDNGKDLTAKKSDLWIADDGHKVATISEGPRIGITKAADHPLRYIVAGNAFVSGKRPATLER
jgi:DNA-3-methyladenine glycosylase